MNPTKSASYRRPRESGGPGQQYRHINHLASTSGRRFAARPWVPAFAGTTTEIQHIGKYKFISGQALRSGAAKLRRVSKDADSACSDCFPRSQQLIEEFRDVVGAPVQDGA